MPPSSDDDSLTASRSISRRRWTSRNGSMRPPTERQSRPTRVASSDLGRPRWNLIDTRASLGDARQGFAVLVVNNEVAGSTHIDAPKSLTAWKHNWNRWATSFFTKSRRSVRNGRPQHLWLPFGVCVCVCVRVCACVIAI